MPTPTESERTGRALSLLLAAWLLIAVGVITLAPYRLVRPDTLTAYWYLHDQRWLSDLLLNVGLFLPVGLVLRNGFPARQDRWALTLLLTGFLLSLLIETTQLFIPGRYSTAIDVLANSAGAWLGALLADRLNRNGMTGRSLAGGLRLELPLTGVVWLLIPALQMQGLAPVAPLRLSTMLPLALAGALSLSAISNWGMTGTMALGLGWALLGTVTLLGSSPGEAGIVVAVVTGMVPLSRLLWRHALRRDRRLEAQVVRILIPLLLLHLLWLEILPSLAPPASVGILIRETIVVTTGQLAGFSILGYLLAESRGRRPMSLAAAALFPAGIALAVQALLAMLVGLDLSFAALLLPVLASGMGAMLYQLQRRYILSLLGLSPGPTDSLQPDRRRQTRS